MQISTILSQVDLGAMALPEFQRGYVWNRDQVRELIDSLYKRHPVGSLLTWKTRTDQTSVKGGQQPQPGFVELILDGQQRITSLYGVMRGKPPQFYERQRNDAPFIGLYFNVETETFKFYSPLEMKNTPLWVNVTDLMQQNVTPFVTSLMSVADPQTFTRYLTRLTNLYGIQQTTLHIEPVTGDHINVDDVVKIFNKLNSGGTKLSKGDLALAKICAAWPDARREMYQRLDKWQKAGFVFSLDWFLRNITTITTNQALFANLADVDTPTFQQGLVKAEKAVDNLLNLISARLGLDHGRVLAGHYAFPVMSNYLVQQGGSFDDIQQVNKLLYWYVHSFLWGRYTGSTESAINQDLNAAQTSPDALDGLIGQLQLMRGDLTIRPNDFGGNSVGARFYPMLYLLTRVLKARDWGNGGLELNAHMLGKLNWLQIHHIFPKSLLYKHPYRRGDVNAITNYCFLTQATNLAISNRSPEEYFPEVEQKYPGALASQWIPLDPELWKIERYPDFLEARRELLATAANSLLASLLVGSRQSEVVSDPAMERSIIAMAPGSADEGERQEITQCNEWVLAQGLPKGEELYELADAETSAPLAIIDMAWPRGLQEGLSQPVALLLNETDEVEDMVTQAGYRFFRNVDDLHAYIEREVLATPMEIS